MNGEQSTPWNGGTPWRYRGTVNIDELIRRIRRDGFVAGVRAATQLADNYLRHEAQVFTGVTEASTNLSFRSYEAMLASPTHGRSGPLGDTLFVEPFFAARVALNKITLVRNHLLTVEELCQSITKS